MLEGQNALQKQCHLSGFQTKPDCCQKSESKYDFLSKFVNCPHCLTIRSYNRIMLWFTQLLCSNLFFQISRGPTAQIPLALLVSLSFQLGQLIGFWLCFTSEPLSQYQKITKSLHLVTLVLISICMIFRYFSLTYENMTSNQWSQVLNLVKFPPKLFHSQRESIFVARLWALPPNHCVSCGELSGTHGCPGRAQWLPPVHSGRPDSAECRSTPPLVPTWPTRCIKLKALWL